MKSVVEDLLASFSVWMTSDLEDYLTVIGEMFTEAEIYAMEPEILFDPDRCPFKALPYLAQYVGERLPEGLTEPQAREWVKDAPNQRRGTVYSIVAAAQRKLTGLRHVNIRERDSGVGTDNSDRLTVTTYDIETPDPVGTLNDLMSVVPADIVLNYQVLTGQTWQSVKDNHDTWQDVKDDYDNWLEVRSERTGLTGYGRPAPI